MAKHSWSHALALFTFSTTTRKKMGKSAGAAIWDTIAMRVYLSATSAKITGMSIVYGCVMNVPFNIDATARTTQKPRQLWPQRNNLLMF